ncbi:2-hydroxychromene-2-carboxylate isomerase [Nitratireductor sp. XY-223]|uniref:2-hydroxychromene-2-carboxylate isomerase n=1 Tax=Nitratireductor sp. XY-223 TaxID=2561926 RepID=UPI0010AA0729|nr:2-hydroxychromene-2-carboxylate isomerase [Nitratireductor sp. XY-223]
MGIQFWFSIGSTYTYLTVTRLPAIEKATGIEFEWYPFSIRAIMKEMNNIPFQKKPVKTRHMWRDIERRAQIYGMKPHVPAPYPLEQFDMANRVAVHAMDKDWLRDYVIVTYRKWFEDGEPAGSEPNLTTTLREIGQDPETVIAAANSPETEAAYQAMTDRARAKDIFGVPSFVVGDELFWGDDRLEDAIAWHRHGHLGQDR